MGMWFGYLQDNILELDARDVDENIKDGDISFS